MAEALLVVDIQNDYFPGGKMELVGSLDACRNVNALIDNFRKRNKKIIYIQHISLKEGATFFLPKTKGAAIHEMIFPKNGDIILQKHYPNSFRETDLDKICKENCIDSLVITGMMTHMCIDTTTRAAFDLGYKCVVIGDCCATKNLKYNEKTIDAESVQHAFLAAINGTFANVINTKEYLAL